MVEVVIQECDESGSLTARKIAFSGVDLLPLQYEDLVGRSLHDSVTVPLSWKRAMVVDSDVPDVSVGQYASVSATLESPYTAKAIALVQGGWLPSGLAVDDGAIVLPDRNIITQIRGRFTNGVKTQESELDFLDFFTRPGIRINPLLYAIEGNVKKIPSEDIVSQQIEEAIGSLSLALPNAHLLPNDGSGLMGAVGIIQDTQSELEKRQKFLLRIAQKLSPPTSAKKRDALWNEVVDAAEHCGVSVKSLVVIAALSAVCVPIGKSPAKRLLKLNNNYTVEHAYNALVDIRCLEILMGLFAMYPSDKIMLCTGDKCMALFWAGIKASNFRWGSGGLEFSVSPVEELLPDMNISQRSVLFEA